MNNLCFKPNFSEWRCSKIDKTESHFNASFKNEVKASLLLLSLCLLVHLNEMIYFIARKTGIVKKGTWKKPCKSI